MSLHQLQSRIPTPVSTYGYAVPQIPTKQIVYDGQPLPRFLLLHKGDPAAYREFLLLNRIGNPFSERELYPGMVVQVPQVREAFSRHPEA